MTNKFDYETVLRFKQDKYSGIIEESDLFEKRTFHRKIGTDTTGKSQFDEVTGWVVSYNKEKIILPETINGKDIRELMPVKILDTNQFSYQTQVYLKPTENGLASFRIEPKYTMSFRDWVDGFYDIGHSNIDDFKLYKLLVLGSYILKYNWRVSTGAGFGKNGIVEVLSILLRDVACFTPKSDPKLMTMLENSLLVIDEWMDLELPRKKILEYVFRGASDGRPDLINNALTSNRHNTKDKYDLSKLSIGFIYNDIEYYIPPEMKKDKSEEYFDNLYTYATRERFLPFKLTGRIDLNSFTPQNHALVYESNKTWYRDWVQSALYFQENIHNLLTSKKDWKWENSEIVGGVNGRLNNMFKQLQLIFKAYSKDEQEYNYLCDHAIDSYWRYMEMVGVKRELQEYDLSSEPVFFNDKMTGIIDNDKFIKTTTNEHFMRKYNGFGISISVLNKLIRRGIKQVIINHTGVSNKYIYRGDLELWINSEFVDEFNNDRQKFVSKLDLEEISKTPISGGTNVLSYGG